MRAEVEVVREFMSAILAKNWARAAQYVNPNHAPQVEQMFDGQLMGFQVGMVAQVADVKYDVAVKVELPATEKMVLVRVVPVQGSPGWQVDLSQLQEVRFGAH
jgi:hypothetical protein